MQKHGCLIKALRHDGGGGFPIEDFGNDAGGGRFLIEGNDKKEVNNSSFAELKIHVSFLWSPFGLIITSFLIPSPFFLLEDALYFRL